MLVTPVEAFTWPMEYAMNSYQTPRIDHALQPELACRSEDNSLLQVISPAVLAVRAYRMRFGACVAITTPWYNVHAPALVVIIGKSVSATVCTRLAYDLKHSRTLTLSWHCNLLYDIREVRHPSCRLRRDKFQQHPPPAVRAVALCNCSYCLSMT